MTSIARIPKEIYFRSPAAVRTLMSSVYGLLQIRKRYGEDFDRHLRFIRESQYFQEDQLIRYRDRTAVGFINDAISQIPFYKNQKEYHLITDASELSSLPLLSKNLVRTHHQKLHHPGLASIPHAWEHTSGTTGKSLQFPLSSDCFQREYAFRALHYKWGGVNLRGKQPFAFCAGHPVAYHDRKKPPYWVYDLANNWLIFSSYHLAEQNMAAYIRELDRFSPVMLGGYPSSIYLLAHAYKKYGNGNFRPTVIFTSSETIFDHQRSVIEASFNAKLLNWYGNSEMVANIVECEQGELHLKHEHSFVEILNDLDRPCGPGETGRLVCTGFGNKAFPLIRYDIGDMVTIAAGQHSKCGRSGLLIDRVEGRCEDYIITPEGRFVGRLDHLFKDSRNVHEAQLFQERPDEVILRLVCDPGYTSRDEQAILREARQRLGNSIAIRFEYLDSIPRTSTGKFRFILSTIDQKQALGAIINH